MAKGSGCLWSFPVGRARVRGTRPGETPLKSERNFAPHLANTFCACGRGELPPLPVGLRTEVFLETQAKIAGFSRRLLVRCFFGFGGLLFFFFFLGDCFSTWHLCCGVDVTSQSDASHPHEPSEQIRARRALLRAREPRARGRGDRGAV